MDDLPSNCKAPWLYGTNRTEKVKPIKLGPNTHSAKIIKIHGGESKHFFKELFQTSSTDIFYFFVLARFHFQFVLY